MKVAIVGSGYVGLTTGACLAHLGHSVICTDSDEKRLLDIAQGSCPIHEEGLPALLRQGLNTGKLKVTPSLERAIGEAQIVLIAVGTPAGENGIDLTAIRRVSRQIGEIVRKDTLYRVIAVKSTVIPGTTERIVRTEIEDASGKMAGRDFSCAMMPEFLSQGSAVKDCLHPDRIVIGIEDVRAQAMMEKLCAPFSAPILVMSIANAEMVKYAANAFQASLISFANQIAGLCEQIPGCDHETVMQAVHLDRNLRGSDGKSVGATHFLKGGLGFGGSCFPKDLLALQHFATMIDAPRAMIDAILQTNRQRIDDVTRLLERHIGSLTGKTIAVLGLAFKPETDDVRESPGIRLAHHLHTKGAIVRTHDPLPAARARARAVLDDHIPIATTPEAALKDVDAAIIATSWPIYQEWDWAALARLMKTAILLDGRGCLTRVPTPAALTVIPVGYGSFSKRR